MTLKNKFWISISILVFGVIVPYLIILVFYREIGISYDNYAKQDALFTLSIVGSLALACFSYIGRLAAKREQSRKYKIIFACLVALGLLLAIAFIWFFNAIATFRYAII